MKIYVDAPMGRLLDAILWVSLAVIAAFVLVGCGYQREQQAACSKACADTIAELCANGCEVTGPVRCTCRYGWAP